MSTNNFYGYNHSLCVQCTLFKKVGGYKFENKFDIRQDPDCSKLLVTRSNFPLPDILDYKWGSVPVRIGRGIVDFFDRDYDLNCPLDCELWDANCTKKSN